MVVGSNIVNWLPLPHLFFTLALSMVRLVRDLLPIGIQDHLRGLKSYVLQFPDILIGNLQSISCKE
jgi:hypothetical protein